ncbi:MAG: HIT family protein [Kiritimatiellia bacterium]|nr:HIT family protein [Kiritimatiellia bacterium]
MNEDCVFCRILSGRLPSETVLDTPDVRAFLDIGPIVKGHVLVIPKDHVEQITDLSAPALHRLAEATQKIARALFDDLDADGVNIFQANGAAAGQVVPHVHYHVIPRYNQDGHHWNWTSQTYSTSQEMTELGRRLRAVLR